MNQREKLKTGGLGQCRYSSTSQTMNCESQRKPSNGGARGTESQRRKRERRSERRSERNRESKEKTREITERRSERLKISI